MGRWDIRPYDLESGRHRIRHYPADPTVSGATGTLAAQDTSFLEGNVLSVAVATQDILAAPDGAYDAATGLHLISCVSSQGLITHHNLADPVAADNVMVPVYDPTSGAMFVTGNVFNGADNIVDMDGANCLIGDSCGWWVDDQVATAIGHIHGIDTDAAGYFTIIRKLDALGRDSLISGQASVAVVFSRAA